MAIRFIDSVRVNADPCQHFDVTVKFDDLIDRTTQIVSGEIGSLFSGIDDLVPGEPELSRDMALALLWMDYQERHGRGNVVMRGKVIVVPIP